MTFNFKTKDQQDIWQILQKINAAWVEGDPNDMSEFLHKDFITSQSDLEVLGQGREDCIRSYVGFALSANILDFQYTDVKIFCMGNTAIARYKYLFSYEMNEDSSEGPGEEAFIFSKEDGKWLAVWRMVIRN